MLGIGLGIELGLHYGLGLGLVKARILVKLDLAVY